MSKNMGNFHTLADLAARLRPNSSVTSCYPATEQSLNFTFASLDAADSALGKLARPTRLWVAADP